MIYGYARVSTKGQTLDSQIEALKAAGCEKIFRETIVGAKAERAQLTQLLVTIGKGDALIVGRLDRLARSTRDLLNIVEALEQRGATFRSLADTWADTTISHGHLIPTVLRGLAAFEGELIRARTHDGRVGAVTRGQHMGRPASLSRHQKLEAAKALAAGMTQADLARRFNVSQSTISRIAAKGTAAVVGPALDRETDHATRMFLKRLDGRYVVVEAIVFGSRARQTHRPDSDADLAVVLDGVKGDRYQAAGEMAGIAFDVMMETGILVEALPLWADDFEQPGAFGNPGLIDSIRREGLRL